MIYTGGTAPAKLLEETRMNKDPIEMIPVNQSEKLDALSRADLAKTYPVEHSNKVKDVGQISDRDLRRLHAYWRDLIGA